MAEDQTPDLTRIAAVMLMPKQKAHPEITDQILANFMDGIYREGSKEHTRVLVALAEDPELREVWENSLKEAPKPGAPAP